MQTKLVSLLEQNIEQIVQSPNNTKKMLDVMTIRKNSKNIVIGNVERHENVFSSNLIVNEDHPYFFDHTLDHVPGILFSQFPTFQKVNIISAPSEVLQIQMK